MSTTTLRLPDEVKARIEKLAAASGKSAHAFMVETLARSAEAMERRLDFEAEAQARWQKFQRSGEYISAEDMHAYVRALAAGHKPPPPPVRKRVPKPPSARRA